MNPTNLLALTALSFSLSGCLLAGMKQQHDNTQAFIAEGQANAAAAQANEHTDMFVATDELWFCPEADDARANAACEGGKRYLRNADVTVIGEAPEDGLWRSVVWDAEGQHPGYVLAEGVNELPDLSELDALVAEIESRYDAGERIPVQSINYVDLVARPKAFAGRFLVIKQRSTDMTNKDFEDGAFTFTIPIPSLQGSKYSASLAQFELASERVVEEFEAGTRSYRCGPSYCDEFLLVARLTGRTVDRTDERGQVYRLPVFEVVEMGDRYGRYGTPQ